MIAICQWRPATIPQQSLIQSQVTSFFHADGAPPPNSAIFLVDDTDFLLESFVDISEQKRAKESLEQALAQSHHLSEELEQAYNKLKTSQVKLLQQEKMATIGQLAAGVAH